MQALAGSTWGADRDLLTTLYKTYIRSKLTYGVAAVASTSNTYMNTLERIQNTAIRIIIGARKTSPITAIQVEADLPPLRMYCQELSCRHYFKTASQKEENPIAKKILNDPEIENKVWTKMFKKPLVKRATEIIGWWRIPQTVEMKVTALPEIPPWDTTKLKIETELIEKTNKDQPTEQAKP